MFSRQLVRLHDWKTEHFKALLNHDHSSVIADHVKLTGHNIKWDHFDILASGKTDYHCKIKETISVPQIWSFFKKKGFSRFQIDLIAIFHLKEILWKNIDSQQSY